MSAILLSLVFAVACGYIAKTKERDTVVWTLLGLLFGVISLIIILMLGHKTYILEIKSENDIDLNPYYNDDDKENLPKLEYDFSDDNKPVHYRKSTSTHIKDIVIIVSGLLVLLICYMWLLSYS